MIRDALVLDSLDEYFDIESHPEQIAALSMEVAYQTINVLGGYNPAEHVDDEIIAMVKNLIIIIKCLKINNESFNDVKEVLSPVNEEFSGEEKPSVAMKSLINLISYFKY